MSPLRVILSGFSILALGNAGPLEAQRRDSTAVDSARVRRAIPLEPVIVTGARVPLTRDALGYALTTVSADDLAAEPKVYAADALRTGPGSFVDEAAGPGGPTIIRLRGGEEVFSQILMDGVQINQSGGFFDFQGFTLSNLDRIEIARGPQSAVYGSSAMSGVVQFVTRRGTADRSYVELVTEAGAHAGPHSETRGGDLEPGGTLRAALTAAGGVDWLGYSVGVGHTYSRGIYELPHNVWTRDASLRLDATPSDRVALTATARYVGVEANLPVRDPGASRVPLDPNATNERDRVITSLGAAFNPRGQWRHRLTTSVYRERFLYDDRRDDVDPSGAFGFFVFDADFALRSVLWRNAVEYAGTVLVPTAGPDLGASISYGARAEREELSDSTSGDFGDGRLTLDRWSQAAFAEVHLDLLGRVNVLTGGRVEKFEGLAAQFTPRASAVISVLPDVIALRAAVGRAYKAPNLQQQFLDNPFIASNPDLEPETSWSFEIGADVQAADGALSLGVTFFHQDFDNLIRTVSQEGTNKQINRNLGESRARGVEWDVRYAARPSWTAGVTGWWTTTEILDNSGLSDLEFPVDSALPFRPTYQSTAYVELVPTDRLDVTLRGTVVGPQITLTERFSGQRVELSSYFLMGVGGGWRISPSARVYTRIENLFNTRYETAFDRRGIPLRFAVGTRIIL